MCEEKQERKSETCAWGSWAVVIENRVEVNCLLIRAEREVLPVVSYCVVFHWEECPHTGRGINVPHDETKMLFMFSLFLSRLPTQFSLLISLFLMLYWCRCYAPYTRLSSYTDISDERSLSLRLKIESDGMEKFSCSRKRIFSHTLTLKWKWSISRHRKTRSITSLDVANNWINLSIRRLTG